MQLPPGFRHTRHEQYLVALPEGLRTRREILIVISVLDRASAYLGAIAAECRAELAARGYSEEDIERLAMPRLPAELLPESGVLLGEPNMLRHECWSP